MKTASLQLVVLAAIVAIVFSEIGPADSKSRTYFSDGSLQAKIQYCTDCHGPSGQGYRGYFPMPRLAGQTTEYLENQLRAFVERRREPHMAMTMSRVHGVSPAMQTSLAGHFSGLNPPPFGRGPRQLEDTGKTIYEQGLPDDYVPACQVCHGPEAKGTGPIPRLAGQLYPYTVKELENWDKERGQGPDSDTSAVMRPIAHSLTKSQIEAVAAYLSDLE
jgi:cytochrome c553